MQARTDEWIRYRVEKPASSSIERKNKTTITSEAATFSRVGNDASLPEFDNDVLVFSDSRSNNADANNT